MGKRKKYSFNNMSKNFKNWHWLGYLASEEKSRIKEITRTPGQHFIFAPQYSHLFLWSEEFYRLTSAGFIPLCLEASHLCTSFSAHENQEEALCPEPEEAKAKARPGAPREAGSGGLSIPGQRQPRVPHPQRTSRDERFQRCWGLGIAPNLTVRLLLVDADQSKRIET